MRCNNSEWFVGEEMADPVVCAKRELESEIRGAGLFVQFLLQTHCLNSSNGGQNVKLTVVFSDFQLATLVCAQSQHPSPHRPTLIRSR